jgi:hypothetical protein
MTKRRAGQVWCHHNLTDNENHHITLIRKLNSGEENYLPNRWLVNNSGMFIDDSCLDGKTYILLSEPKIKYLSRFQLIVREINEVL